MDSYNWVQTLKKPQKYFKNCTRNLTEDKVWREIEIVYKTCQHATARGKLELYKKMNAACLQHLSSFYSQAESSVHPHIGHLGCKIILVVAI